MAFGAVLVLGACQAAGGGYIGDPLGGGPDSFSIQLIGGADNGYTRGGYIEGGNVPVESSK